MIVFVASSTRRRIKSALALPPNIPAEQAPKRRKRNQKQALEQLVAEVRDCRRKVQATHEVVHEVEATRKAVIRELVRELQEIREEIHKQKTAASGSAV